MRGNGGYCFCSEKAGQSEASVGQQLAGKKAVEMAGGSGFNALFP